MQTARKEQEQQQQQQDQQKQQQQAGASDEQQGEEGYFNFLGLKLSKDDIITITIALVISYGIRA